MRTRTPALAGVAFTAVLTLLAATTSAQPTGLVRGTIVDESEAPLADVRVTMEMQEDPPLRFFAVSDDKGQYMQIGLPPGPYKVSAERTGLGRQTFDVRVRLGQTSEVNFRLVPGETSAGTGDPMAEDVARTQALTMAFDAGVEAARAGRHTDAIAKFGEALDILPTCHQCYFNIGVEHSMLQAYDEAEAAFQKAIDIQPDYAEAYTGLATIYNSQRRFDEAQAASAEAARYSTGAAGLLSGGNPAQATFREAIILWNASKIPEAKAKLEEVLTFDATHAESHYWLGMANLNEGDLSTAASMFERYVELAPDGQYVEQVRGILAQVKP